MANHVLIMSNGEADARALREVLAHAHDGPFEVQWRRTLAAGLAHLQAGETDVVMLDLDLPDSSGLATLERVLEAAPLIAVMTLCAPHDESLAAAAVQRGSQGYLLKGQLDSYLVPQSVRNLIQRKDVEHSVALEKARAEITLNSISDAVVGTDLCGNVDYLNVAAESLTGWSKDEARGVPIGEVMQIVDRATLEPTRHPAERVLEQDEAVSMTAGSLLIRRDGSTVAIEDSAAPIHDLSGQIAGAVVVFHDITDAQAKAAEMTRLAQHDFLTGLPNRILLNDRIAQAIAQAARQHTHLAVMFLDLDDFKQINDTLGHAVGDRLLQSVAQRLSACVRDSDTVSRRGGDEFVLLLGEDKKAENAALSAQRILDALALPHQIDGHALQVTTSIGISIYPLDADNAHELIKNADTAMYHAKENGRNQFQFFRRDMNMRAVERQQIEAQLRHALKHNEFVLHYQPKVNLESGEITGAEALVRWMHPEHGMMLPARFVPLAQESGLIVPIGQWVLREACQQLKHWDRRGLHVASVGVNISTEEFRHAGFVQSVRAILQDTALAPERLQLEIAESVLMHDAPASITVLQALKQMGVQLAVDDFGTGYSSLSYLMEFPIDVLKIDPSFVRDIGARQAPGEQASAVSAVIAMGASLNQRVIAEGIEKSAQLAFLRDQQCEEGQGYLFSRPVPAERFAALLESGLSDRFSAAAAHQTVASNTRR